MERAPRALLLIALQLNLGVRPQQAPMKRYRVTSFDFETRANLLSMAIEDHWEPHIKEMHLQNKESIRGGLAFEFGNYALTAKIQNFVDLGPKPLSILAFHNEFAAQARAAFVVGGYYPSLVGACTLGERILNHLIRLLREDFKSSDYYKRVYRKDSFDNWQLPLAALESWGVLLPDALEAFRRLNTIRNQAVHFHPEVDNNDRPLALEANLQLAKAIEVQFGSLGPQPWFIPDTRGATYIRKEAEEDPFVKRVYLPNCQRVGPWHQPLRMESGHLIISDQYPYVEREISDDEFRTLLGTNPPALEA